MHTLIFVLIPTLFASYDACILYGTGVSQTEQFSIINKHNLFRQNIMKGEVSGQPKGKNLKTISWDDALAADAQATANACTYPAGDITDDRFDVGENIVIVTSTSLNPSADWNSILQNWFNENKIFNYPELTDATRHYTQLVWGDTQLVGCGYTSYREEASEDAYRAFYVCYYGPAGNVANSVPYELA